MMMKSSHAELTQEIASSFVKFLQLEEAEALELTKYILSIKSKDHLRDYLSSLLSVEQPEISSFVESLQRQLFPDLPKPVQTSSVGSKYKVKKVNYVITGNEPGRPLQVVNCLNCGFIYRREDFEKLSLCSFCENPLGKKGRSALGSPEATKLRDRLVGFDASATERTKVLDDQSDYFDSRINSAWSDQTEKDTAKSEKEKFERQIEDQKRQIHLSLDVKSKKFVEVDPNLPKSANKVYEIVKGLM